MEYTIENKTRLSRAFSVKGGGLVVIKPGASATIQMRAPMPADRIAALKRDGVEVTANQQADIEPEHAESPAPEPAPAPESDAAPADLRAQYEALTGKAADGRWNDARVAAEIEALQKA